MARVDDQGESYRCVNHALAKAMVDFAHHKHKIEFDQDVMLHLIMALLIEPNNYMDPVRYDGQVINIIKGTQCCDVNDKKETKRYFSVQLNVKHLHKHEVPNYFKLDNDGNFEMVYLLSKLQHCLYVKRIFTDDTSTVWCNCINSHGSHNNEEPDYRLMDEDVNIFSVKATITLRDESRLPSHFQPPPHGEMFENGDERMDFGGNFSPSYNELLGTLAALKYLAECMFNQGNYDGSRRTFEKLLALSTRIRGEQDEDTLRCLTNIARCMLRQQQYEEAEQVCERVYCVWRRTLGEEDVALLTTMNNLALCKVELNKHSEAKEMYEQIHDVKVRVRGSEHPSTLITKINMATLIYEQGDVAHAHEMFEDVYEVMKRVLGDSHPHTLITGDWITNCLVDEEENEKALELRKDIYEKSKITLGDSHPETLRYKRNYAILLKKMSK